MGSIRGSGAAAACLTALLAASSSMPAAARQRDGAGYTELLAQSIHTIELIDNGDFRDLREPEHGAKASGFGWWVGPGSSNAGQPSPETPGCVLLPGETLRQPVAAFAPLAGGLAFQAQIDGRARITLIDGAGGRASVELPADHARTVHIDGRQFEAALGRPLVPRLVLEIEATESGGSTSFRDVRVAVPLPTASEERLKAEISAQLHAMFDVWLARSVDREGPKPTAFTCNLLDVVTGEVLVRGAAVNQPQPVYELMLEAWAVEKDSTWQVALERYLEDLLTLGLNPQTGLPRKWDCARDQPVDGEPIEIAKALGFLIDAHLHGPEPFRARALAAALRIGETVLAKGVLPDGSIAPAYVPADGAPRTDVASLRRLDVPAELARLSKLTGDARFVDAARRAIAELEFTNHWPGTWQSLDPGFDDSYGHYGARAVTMLEAFPGDPVFRRLALSGWKTYAPLWRDALRFGGSIAADQVRCWDLLERFARLEPSIAAEFGEVVQRAARAHFKGEQYDNGAWGDVTFFRFDPKTGLAVGDLPGAPANLLWGLGILYRKTLTIGGATPGALSRDDVRAMYTAVLRSSAGAYARPYGWLSTQRERAGANSGGGELRFARGLVEMLAQL